MQHVGIRVKPLRYWPLGCAVLISTLRGQSGVCVNQSQSQRLALRKRKTTKQKKKQQTDKKYSSNELINESIKDIKLSHEVCIVSDLI